MEAVVATVICKACGKEVDQRVVPGETCPCRCHAVRDVVADCQQGVLAMMGHSPLSHMRTLRLDEIREMTADLPDDTEVVLMLPGDTDDWRQTGLDVSVDGPNFGGSTGWTKPVIVIEGDG